MKDHKLSDALYTCTVKDTSITVHSNLTTYTQWLYEEITQSKLSPEDAESYVDEWKRDNIS